MDCNNYMGFSNQNASPNFNRNTYANEEAYFHAPASYPYPSTYCTAGDKEGLLARDAVHERRLRFAVLALVSSGVCNLGRCRIPIRTSRNERNTLSRVSRHEAIRFRTESQPA